MSTTINKEEIQKFSKLADEWWDVNGKFKPLHMFNPIRIEYITENIKKHYKIKKDSANFLKGLNILDIGCGGGLISEPMARLGANVTGIDASEKNVKIAKLHSEKNGLKINYIHTSPEKLNELAKFDIILNLEIIEHVNDVNLFLKSSSEMLAKNGIMFIATINRTFESYIKAIVGAEYILRWLPIGTHEWEKFVKPSELEKILKKYDLRLDSLDGMKFNLLKDEWKVSKDKSINYIGRFIKN